MSGRGLSHSFVLPTSIASAEDLREASDELHQGAIAGKRVSPSTLSDGARDLLTTFGCAIDDKTAVAELVHRLGETYKVAPRVSITLAAPVDPSIKKQLTAWFRENCSPLTLVSFGFNRAILGGILVRAGSRIYDWSYRSKLLDSQINFSEVMERV